MNKVVEIPHWRNDFSRIGYFVSFPVGDTTGIVCNQAHWKEGLRVYKIFRVTNASPERTLILKSPNYAIV